MKPDRFHAPRPGSGRTWCGLSVARMTAFGQLGTDAHPADCANCLRVMHGWPDGADPLPRCPVCGYADAICQGRCLAGPAAELGLARDRACAKCGAPPGAPCRDRKGRAARDHAARYVPEGSTP
jgi:hypothetical protein